MNHVDWLLVGTGDIANKRVAPALNSVAGSQLVGVCDVVPDRAQALARSMGAPEVFADFDQALAQTKASAVYLATPVFLHAEHTVRALAAGKHVLVEKPLGLNGAEADRAVAAARGGNLRAGCAYFRRCYPRYRHAQEMLERGEFGRVVLVRMTYFSWFNPDPADPKYWRVVRAKSGGGPLSDMGSHMFDVLIGLFGLPKRLCANVKTLVQPYEVEDSAVMTMELANGADVIAGFHWNSRTWAHEFEIVGTEAKVKWFPYDAGKIILTRGRDTQEIDRPNPENVHVPLIEDFISAIRDHRDPVVSLAEAARTNILLDAVYQSARTRKEITL
jgi:predicted dehydrogenase